MRAKYSEDFLINPSRCEARGVQSADNTFDLFIDIAGEHAAELKIGATDLMKRGLFWIVAKTKIRFYEHPRLYDKVIASTWPETGADYRCYRGYTIEKNGKVIVAGRQQWAIVDGKTKKPVNVADILPDTVEYLSDRAIEGDFNRITGEFPKEPFAVYKVKSTDIDFVGHMNNVAYIRALESLYTCKEWAALDPYEIEISYAAPCYEGDELLFKKREITGGFEIATQSENGKNVAYYTIKERPAHE